MSHSILLNYRQNCGKKELWHRIGNHIAKKFSNMKPKNHKIKRVGSSQNNRQKSKTNTVKDPENWTTGSEPMTGAQRSYLHTLSDEAGVDPKDDLTKAEASKKIEELQHKTGRGL